MTDTAAVRVQLEQYYDAVPRAQARSEDFGALTLFVRDGPGYPYYARPTLGHPGPVTADDVDAARRRQRQLGVPEAFEWVAETTPSLQAAAITAGLLVHRHPLMVLGSAGDSARTSARTSALTSARTAARILAPGDPALAAALAVPDIAFADPGTQVGSAGLAELAARTAEVAADGRADRVAARIGSHATVMAAVFDGETPVCAGQHIPVGTTTEIVGVGTLPAARRRGLARAVTATLVADARARGIQTIFLSAGDADVARIYARLGFERVGTAFIAESASPDTRAG